MRDSLLAVAGRLDLTQGGRAIDITDAAATRRTVYGFVERQNLPGLFRTFDFASPDISNSRRFSTTVPQQALYMMNSPFVVRQAQAFAARPDVQSLPGDDRKIRRLHQLAFQRDPDADELRLARAFLAGQSAADTAPEGPAWSYGHGQFHHKEQRVTDFTPLPHWNGYAWQGGPTLPDPRTGWALLSAEGGHPGDNPAHAAIRRWRAPHDGAVRLAARLQHQTSRGDGVRARVVSSRQGLLGEWTAYNSTTATPLDRIVVQRGERIDFVTDCRSGTDSDSFLWAPTLEWIGGSRAGERVSAQAEFEGPAKGPEKTALNAWEKYAQVLLLANELLFVD